MMQIINNINRIAGVKSTSKKPSTPVLYTKRTFASLTLRHRSSHTRFTLPSTVFIPSRSVGKLPPGTPLPSNSASMQQLYAPVNVRVMPNISYCNTIMRNRNQGLSNCDIAKRIAFLCKNAIHNNMLLRTHIPSIYNYKQLTTQKLPKFYEDIILLKLLQDMKKDPLLIIKFLINALNKNEKIPYEIIDIFKNTLKDNPNFNINETFIILNNLLEEYFEKQHLMQQKENEITNNTPALQQQIKTLIIKNNIERLFTMEDRIQKVNYCLEGKQLLQNNFEAMTIQEKINLIINSGIIHYPNVTYKGEYEYQNFIIKETVNLKEMEGLKITHFGYKLLQDNMEIFYETQKGILLTKQQKQAICNSLIDKKYSFGLLKILPKIDVEFLSSEHLHIIIVVRDYENAAYGYHLGMLTSAKDGTILLSTRQEINKNEKEKEKAQMFRSTNKCLYIRLESDEPDKIGFKEIHRITAYAKGFSENGVNTHDILIKNVMDHLNNNTILVYHEPISFTLELLKVLAIKAYDSQIQDQETVIKNLEKMPKEKQKRKQEEAQKQKQNYLKTEKEKKFQNNLSMSDKLLYKIHHLILCRLKQIEDDKNKVIINTENFNQENENNDQS